MLEERGHRAHAIDLPGHEADPTPAATVTLKDYVRAIDAALRARGGRSVLVGAIRSAAFETRAVETTARLRAAN
jgi:hypothetical protein